MDKTVAASTASQERLGATLVFLSAVIWSFGGAIARFLTIADSWTVIFWRALFAAIFLLGFLLVRDGPRRTIRLYRDMGVPGLLVGLGFATASTCFIIAIGYTTVANVVLIQAGVPLFAALMAWIIYREPISFTTWLAIIAVLVGVAIMVMGGPLIAGADDLLGLGLSDGAETATANPAIDMRYAWFGNLLALTIALAISMVTVVTRRFPGVRQTPGASVGCFAASLVAFSQAGSVQVTGGELAILAAFGMLNLGLGMAFFVTGARMVPAAFAAILGTAETMLSPVWVAIFHGEVPGIETIIGGTILLVALLAYLYSALRKQQSAAPAPLPNQAAQLDKGG